MSFEYQIDKFQFKFNVNEVYGRCEHYYNGEMLGYIYLYSISRLIGADYRYQKLLGAIHVPSSSCCELGSW